MKQIFNPILPDYEYIPDPEPHVFKDIIPKFKRTSNPGNNNPLPTLYVHISVRSD